MNSGNGSLDSLQFNRNIHNVELVDVDVLLGANGLDHLAVTVKGCLAETCVDSHACCTNRVLVNAPGYCQPSLGISLEKLIYFVKCLHYCLF